MSYYQSNQFKANCIRFFSKFYILVRKIHNAVDGLGFGTQSHGLKTLWHKNVLTMT